MKKTVYLVPGIWLLIPMAIFAQDSAFVTRNEFKSEKQKVQQSMNLVKKAISTTSLENVKQQSVNDSLFILLAQTQLLVQQLSDSVALANDAVAMAQTRLSRQKQTGTLFVIMLPSILFLLLILLFILIMGVRRKGIDDTDLVRKDIETLKSDLVRLITGLEKEFSEHNEKANRKFGEYHKEAAENQQRWEESFVRQTEVQKDIESGLLKKILHGEEQLTALIAPVKSAIPELKEALEALKQAHRKELSDLRNDFSEHRKTHGSH